MTRRKKRHVLYKTDEWNRPIFWQWFSVSPDQKVDWARQTFFCELFSDFTKWEAIHDPDAENTKLDNMLFVSGFESEAQAIEHGLAKGWMKKIEAGRIKARG